MAIELQIDHHVVALDKHGDGLRDIRPLHHGCTWLDIDGVGAGAEALGVAVGLPGADFCFIFAPCGYDEPEILPP